MNKFQAALIGLLAVSVSGCAAYGPKVGSSYESYDKHYAPQMVKLAEEVAGDIAVQYPNKLVFVDASHEEGSFAALLRRSLANRKALAITSPMSDVKVRFAIEELTTGLGYLNLRFDDGSAKSKTFFLIPPNTYDIYSKSTETPTPSELAEKPEASIASLDENAPAEELPALEEQKPAETAVAVTPLQEETVAKSEVKPTIVPITTHTVQEGDTVAKIARKYGIPFKQLCEENGGIEKCQIIKPGQILNLPQGAVFEKQPASAEPKIATPPVMTEQKLAETPVVEQPVAPTSQKGIIPRWSLTPGSLRTQIQKWCETSGYQLVWNTTTDLDMEASATFYGDFAEAIAQLFDGLHEAGHALTATLYKGNSVLEVGDK